MTHPTCASANGMIGASRTKGAFSLQQRGARLSIGPSERWHEDKDKPKRVTPDVEDAVDVADKLLNQQPACDRILHSKASLQMGESMNVGRATK
jgi:hypothetical protein